MTSPVNKTFFIEQMKKIVHLHLESHFLLSVDPIWVFTNLKITDQAFFAEENAKAVIRIEKTLKNWREKREKCEPGERFECENCLYQQECISLSSTGKLFHQMTDSQIGKICRLITMVFSDSVCTTT